MLALFAEIAVAAVAFVFVGIVITRVRRSSATTTPRCRRCEYPVVGLPEPRCPECGSDLWAPGAVLHGPRRRPLVWMLLVLWTALVPTVAIALVKWNLIPYAVRRTERSVVFERDEPTTADLQIVIEAESDTLRFDTSSLLSDPFPGLRVTVENQPATQLLVRTSDMRCLPPSAARNANPTWVPFDEQAVVQWLTDVHQAPDPNALLPAFIYEQVHALGTVGYVDRTNVLASSGHGYAVWHRSAASVRTVRPPGLMAVYPYVFITLWTLGAVYIVRRSRPRSV